jgi:hypothetical protein
MYGGRDSLSRLSFNFSNATEKIMSFTQFFCTAKCSVRENFNLESYVEELAIFIASGSDEMPDEVTYEFENCNTEEISDSLLDYFALVGEQLIINVDSEENSTSVHDWLTTQVIKDVMTSKFMEINSAFYDSRSGLSSCVSFYDKECKEIEIDKALNAVL